MGKVVLLGIFASLFTLPTLYSYLKKNQDRSLKNCWSNGEILDLQKEHDNLKSLVSRMAQKKQKASILLIHKAFYGREEKVRYFLDERHKNREVEDFKDKLIDVTLFLQLELGEKGLLIQKGKNKHSIFGFSKPSKEP